VGRTDFESAEQIPFRIEPEVGQISEDEVDTSSHKAPNVLQEHEIWSHRANDLGDVGPKPSLVVGSLFDASGAPRLARESRSDEIHESSKLLAWEGCEIVPDRSLIQGLFFHARHEYGRGVGVPLTSGHKTGSDAGESQSELDSGNPGAEAESVEGRCSHIYRGPV
jgi:hypothetical protein